MACVLQREDAGELFAFLVDDMLGYRFNRHGVDLSREHGIVRPGLKNSSYDRVVLAVSLLRAERAIIWAVFQTFTGSDCGSSSLERVETSSDSDKTARLDAESGTMPCGFTCVVSPIARFRVIVLFAWGPGNAARRAWTCGDE